MDAKTKEEFERLIKSLDTYGLLVIDYHKYGHTNVWLMGDSARETGTTWYLAKRYGLVTGENSLLNERFLKNILIYTNNHVSSIIRHPLCKVPRRVFGWPKIWYKLIGWTGLFKKWFEEEVVWIASRDQIEAVSFGCDWDKRLRDIDWYYENSFMEFGPCKTDMRTVRLKYFHKKEDWLLKYRAHFSTLVASIFRTYFTKKERSDTTINLMKYVDYFTIYEPTWISWLALKIFQKRDLQADLDLYYKNNSLKLNEFAREFVVELMSRKKEKND